MKHKSKHNHLKSVTQNEYDRCIQLTYSIENSDFFDINKVLTIISPITITKFVLYLAKYDFELIFNNSNPQIKTKYHQFTKIISLKRIFHIGLIILF